MTLCSHVYGDEVHAGRCLAREYGLQASMRRKLTRTLEDTQPPEVRQGALKLLDGGRASHIGLGCPRLSFLL